VRGRSKGYNIILSPSKAKSSALKVYEDVLASLGFNTPCKQTELFLTSCEKAEAEKYYSVKGILKNDRIIGLQPGASWPAKIWKKEGFAALGDRLHKEGYKVVLFGGPKDRHITKEVYELMKTKPMLANGGSLRGDAALIEKLNCFVTNDHGPMHISAAVGTPLVAVFGPGEPEIWFPYEDKKYVFIQNRQKCAPCRKKECEDMKCMKAVSVEQVYEKVRAVCR
jgi:lipopolysaccharide heptosyltransferase II